MEDDVVRWYEFKGESSWALLLLLNALVPAGVSAGHPLITFSEQALQTTFQDALSVGVRYHDLRESCRDLRR
jgi:hypothetical protein